MEHQQQILSLKGHDAITSNKGAVVRNTKMPKLVISKFDGTPQDWVRFWGRFWGQFSSLIDSAKEPAITKFSYLN